MSFKPDDYELSIRSVDPSYNHTLARDSNRKDTEHETHLSSITVSIHLRAGRSASDNHTTTFEAVFDVEHALGDAGVVSFRSVGDKHERKTAFDPEKFWYVSEFAAAVVDEWLDSVGLPYRAPEHSITMWDRPPEPTVHTSLAVEPDQEAAADD